MAQTVLAPEKRIGTGKPGPGRPAGVPNAMTGQLRQMVVDALEAVGGVDYLAAQAILNPGPFLALVGKTMPLQLTGDMENPVVIGVVTRRIVRPEK